MINIGTPKTILISITFGTCLYFASQPMSAHAEINLVFGTYAAEKPTVTVKKLRPILNAIESEMAKIAGQTVNIRLNISKNYDAAIQDILKGKVDFARFGQAAYVMAKAVQPELKIIAVEGDHAKKSFRSMIVVRADSSITEISDLFGATFAFGSEYSTTGRYLPQSFLTRHGITAQMLSKYAYLGRHDRVASAVSDGLFEAGAISEWVFKDMVSKGANLRSIASFSSVTKPWIASPLLSKETIAIISKSLIALRGVPVLGLIKKDCFLPGEDRDYAMTRASILNNWAFFRRHVK